MNPTDPLPDSTGSAEQGMRRAELLLDDQVRRQVVHKRTPELVELEKSDHEGATRLQKAPDLCVLENVYVGDHTLELDLLPLLGNELVPASAELAAG